MVESKTIAVSSEIWLAATTEADRASISRLLNDRQISDRMLRVPHPYSESDFDEFLRLAQENTQLRNFTIHHSEHGPIGGFGFEALRHGHRVEIGFWLGRQFRGRGIMPAVIRAACEYAFRAFRVHRITAHVFTSNSASARALQKCGFVYEGLLRSYFVRNQDAFDARLFSLLKPDLVNPGLSAELQSPKTFRMDSLRIVHATERDLPEVASLFDLYRQFYGQVEDLTEAIEFVGARLSRRDSTILLARCDNAAVGFTQLYPSFSSVSMRPVLILNDLFVTAPARRKGIGDALVEAAEQFGRQQNCCRLCLCTEISNTMAQTLYASRGWIRDEEFYYYSLEV